MAFRSTATTLLKRRGFNGFHGCLHSFKSLILYSTSSAPSNSKHGITITNPLMVEYLVKSIGFSEDEALSITTKVRRPLICTQKSQLVVDFLKNSGFDATQIRRVIATAPEVLRHDVEETLKPKIRAFEELGLSGSDLGLIISQNPYVLYRSLNAHIVPSLKMLKSLVGCNEQLTVLLKTKSQQLLSCNLLKNVPDNLLLLQSHGMPSERIKKLILQRPLFLLQSTRWVEKIVKRVKEKLGIPPTSGMFVHGISALSRKSDDSIESWLGIFHSFGWNQTEIFNLLRKQPVTLALSEKNLRVKLKYLMEDLGYGSDCLAKRPVLLSYSMEKRIVPRTAVIKALKEKQLLRRDVGFSAFVCMPEPKFVEKYVLPVKDTLPELYQYYIKTAGSSLSKA